MGSGQSILPIYLKHINDAHGDGNYDVKTVKFFSRDCKNFVVVSHVITYRPDDGRNYDIYLYNNKREQTKGNYVFAYCSPSNFNEVVKRIEVYFSTILPDVPLIITFVTKKDNYYSCLYDDLKYYRWDYASNIYKYRISEKLESELPNQYIERSRNRKITFKVEEENNDAKTDSNKENKNTTENNSTTENGKTKKNEKTKENVSIKENYYELGSEKKYKICKYTPDFDKQQPFELYNNNLFKLQPKQNHANQPIVTQVNKIDPSNLTDVKDNHFDGICVYYIIDQQIALLVEFLDGCSFKHQYIKKDKVGYWWNKQLITYNDDENLVARLEEIYNDSEAKDLIIYKIEKKSKYNEIKVEKDNKKTHEGYSKYTHTHEKEKPNNKRTVILQNYKEINLETTYDKLTNLNIYFLRDKQKTKSKTKTKENDEDDIPFLIELNLNEKNEKAYYTKKSNSDKGWTKIQKDNDIEKKLKKINDNKTCLGNFYVLREWAYQILLEELFKEISPPKAPDLLRDKYTGYVLTQQDVWAISGSTTVVIVVSSVCGYGIYWYNTTIKLLT